MESFKQYFAVDSFYTPAGQLDISSKEPLNIAFIGGSLTEGEIDYEGTSLSDANLKWSNVMLKFLSALFPFRPIKAVNAGLGGTGSEYGAIRFGRDVLSCEPDLIFIEFSCNDRPVSDADISDNGKIHRQIHLESMIRQCMEARKVPTIIYMHVPMPLVGADAEFYRRGCEFKQEIVDYYGIGCVDAMGDLMREYEAQNTLDPSLSFPDFLKKYYPQYDNGGFNVHPYGSGYLLFAKSLINALMHSPEKYFRRFVMRDEPYLLAHRDSLNERYRYIPASSDRISYTGKWTFYNENNHLLADEPGVRINNYKFVQPHQFPDGIMQTYKAHSAEFSFVSGADRFCMPHISAKAGLGADVYADGVLVGRLSCHSPWHGMNYKGNWVNLPSGKKTVTVKIDKATNDEYVFRFGYIVESFREKQ